MAISYIAETGVSGGTGTEPTGTIQGDFLLASAMSTSSSLAAPSGWTQIGTTVTASSYTAGLWYCIRGASAPSYVWTNVAGSNDGVTIVTFRGVNPTTPFDASAQSSAGSAVAPTISAANATDWLVCPYCDAASTTIAAPTGMTLAGGDTVYSVIAYLALSAAGATGTKTFTSTTSPIGAWSLALQAAYDPTMTAVEDLARRTRTAATHSDRRVVPQQRVYNQILIPAVPLSQELAWPASFSLQANRLALATQLGFRPDSHVQYAQKDMRDANRVASSGGGGGGTVQYSSTTPAPKYSGYLGTQTASVTSNSFSPPANSVIVVMVSAGESYYVGWNTPTITDSLGTHLTWTLNGTQADGSTDSDGAWVFSAQCPTAQTSMTVTVGIGLVNNSQYVTTAVVAPLVVTGASTTAPVVNVAAATNTSTTASATISPLNTGSAIAMVACRYCAAGPTNDTAGTGGYLWESQVAGSFCHGMTWLGTSTAFTPTTQSVPTTISLVTTDTTVTWGSVAFEIAPAPASSGTNPTPLDSAWQVGGLYTTLYNAAASESAFSRRVVGQQLPLRGDLSLLNPPVVAVNSSLDDITRHSSWFADRRVYPKQLELRGDLSLLAQALLEQALLGGQDDLARHRQWFTDQRQYPKQLPLLGDLSLLAQALLEVPPPLPVRIIPATTVLVPQRSLVSDPNLLNPVVAAIPPPLQVRVPSPVVGFTPQRPLVSDPNLLTTALLEVPPPLPVRTPPTVTVAPQQRSLISDPSFYPMSGYTDPTTLGGVGSPTWAAYAVPTTHVDRRFVPQQRILASDPLLLTTALLEVPPPLLSRIPPSTTWQPQQHILASDPNLYIVVTPLDPTLAGYLPRLVATYLPQGGTSLSPQRVVPVAQASLALYDPTLAPAARTLAWWPSTTSPRAPTTYNQIAPSYDVNQAPGPRTVVNWPGLWTPQQRQLVADPSISPGSTWDPTFSPPSRALLWMPQTTTQPPQSGRGNVLPGAGYTGVPLPVSWMLSAYLDRRQVNATVTKPSDPTIFNYDPTTAPNWAAVQRLAAFWIPQWPYVAPRTPSALFAAAAGVQDIVYVFYRTPENWQFGFAADSWGIRSVPTTSEAWKFMYGGEYGNS